MPASKNAQKKSCTKKKLLTHIYQNNFLKKRLVKSVIEEIKNMGASSPAEMGRVIGAVKGKLGASADGSVIARLVKENIPQ
jgi:uncharacterized protein YqeY